jgi:hypothetical protein
MTNPTYVFSLRADVIANGIEKRGGIMSGTLTIAPAQELAARNQSHFPNESREYRVARNVLLAEEINLRRQIEQVAAQRRALPVGGKIPRDFDLVSRNRQDCVLQSVRRQGHAMVYSMMYGPQRRAPCPMCTSFLTSWNGTAVNLRERVAIAVTARSPIERLIDYKRQLGFINLPFVSDPSGRIHPHVRQRGRRGCSRLQCLPLRRNGARITLYRRDER